MIGMSGASFVPWLGVSTPTVGVVALHDHPGVLLQLRRVKTFEQRLGETLDQQRLELRRQPALEELDANERHRALSAPRAARRRLARARGRGSCPARGRAERA